MIIALILSLASLGLLHYTNNRLRRVISMLRLKRSNRSRKLLLEVNCLKMRNKELLQLLKEK